jgi:hypothetical protein
MIIIDNNPLSYDNNVSNGIPILSWYEDTNDKELLKLIPILKYMSNNDVYDVRNIINKIVDRNSNNIDYNAINKIMNSNKEEKINTNNENNSYLLTKNDYKRINKSEEPRLKIINNKDSKKPEEKYDYPSTKSKIMTLKNNFSDKYENEILNSKYNIHNIYHYNFDQKLNINIDKKDPYGTRISIFAPGNIILLIKIKITITLSTEICILLIQWKKKKMVISAKLLIHNPTITIIYLINIIKAHIQIRSI